MEIVMFKLFQFLEEAATSHLGRGPLRNLYRITQAVPLLFCIVMDGMCCVACDTWYVVCGVCVNLKLNVSSNL